MDENKQVKSSPKKNINYLSRSLSKIGILKKIQIFSHTHFNSAEKEIEGKIKVYKKVSRTASRAWKIVKLSREETRPQASDYIREIFTDFIEMEGDRLASADKSILCGFAKINKKTVAVIGHNKGKDIKDKIKNNFGMSIPQGYRKTQRIIRLAERFHFPVITLIDTPGAYPAIEAEDSGQAAAIATNISLLFEVKVPVIAVLIGEGGSGGALALAIGNHIMMLENATYSVISPEGCAAILYKDASMAKDAAGALKITSRDLYKLGVIDKIIHEPFGGAQNDCKRMAAILKKNILSAMTVLTKMPSDELKEQRAQKFEKIGFTSFNYQQKE
jgi:acetyl-CoA carboxylase carboxyl transferase subunit alpha